MIPTSYLHIETRYLVKILPTTPTCFSLSRPSSGSFVLPYFEVANASMLNIYGTAAACACGYACDYAPGGSCYFTCIQNMKLVTNKFKSGGLHEKHVVANWNLGNHLNFCL